MMQRIDVVQMGVPPRAELDAMLAAPWKTDVPRHWIVRLSKARDQFDEADQLPDGSERLCELVDCASDIEEEAVEAFQVRLFSPGPNGISLRTCRLREAGAHARRIPDQGRIKVSRP